jgi:serine/threonine protein kinase
MLTGATPFTGRNKLELQKNVEIGFYKLPRNIKLSLKCLDFLNNSLSFDSNKRLEISKLLEHPYLSGIEYKNISNKYDDIYED